ncbi:MAG TPA: response regulator [Ruminiclostridium sp.]
MENLTQFSIIVVEDEEYILKSIVRKINKTNTGFNIVGAVSDGNQALELIGKVLPDVLITDIQMPVMDGLELLRIMSQKYPHIKKIVLSGYDDFKYAQKAMKYNVKNYLLKPLKIDILTEVLLQLRILLEHERGLIQQNKIHINDQSSYTAEEIIKLVETYIQENFTMDINFESIAQNFNFNSSYLTKIFSKYIGETPSKYLITLRINKSKHLLIHNKELSIREVGELVGYTDQFHFSRMFKNMTGFSPASYREK